MLGPPELNSSSPPGVPLVKVGARREPVTAPSWPRDEISSHTTGALTFIAVTNAPLALPVPGAKENMLAKRFRPMSVGFVPVQAPWALHGPSRSRLNDKGGLTAPADEAKPHAAMDAHKTNERRILYSRALPLAAPAPRGQPTTLRKGIDGL